MLPRVPAFPGVAMPAPVTPYAPDPRQAGYGAPAAPPPELLPLPQQQQPQQVPMGFGGMGGGVPMAAPQNGPTPGGWGDITKALGFSLMSSPSNVPLQNFGQFYGQMQGQTQEKADKLKAEHQRNQTVEYLRRKYPDIADLVDAGLPVKEGLVLAIERDQSMKEQEADANWMNQIGGVLGGGGAAGQEAAAPAQSASWPNLPAPGGGSDQRGVLEEMAGAEEDVQPAPSDVPITNPEYQALLARREQLARMPARTERQQKILDRQIAQVDQQLDALEPTTSQRDYVFAMQQRKAQGLPIIPIDEWDLAQRRAGATSIKNVGSIPPGYEVEYDENGNPVRMFPIPGSPAAQEAEAAQQSVDSQNAQEAIYGDIVLNDIERVQEKIQNAPWYSPTTGLVGNFLKDYGGTAAADVKSLTDTIGANIGFDRLQAMREASPTGGALGSVTERELGLLQSTLGSLSQSQSEDQLMENLDRLEKVYSQISRKAAAYPNASQFGFTAPSSDAARPTTQEQYDALPSGALFIDPDDGKTYQKP